MFQYAAGRALAAQYNVPLKLDLRWMKRYRHREFLLHKFPIIIERPSRFEYLKFTWFPFQMHPFHIFLKHIEKYNKNIYMERKPSFDPNFRNLGPDRFLFGYFQSEKYFKDYGSLIRKDFSYEPDITLYDNEVIEALKSPGSTAVQIRRGDYVTNAAVNRIIGECPMEYYRKAVTYLKGSVKDYRLLIFSDDIAWCRENIKFDRTVFAERRGGTPLHDMSLAGQCKNIILANSTFSWWSAWLNKNPRKIVIAPKQWFRSEERQKYAHDLTPQDWIRL